MNIVTGLFPSFHPRQVMFRAVLFMRILNSITFGGDGVASEKNKKHSVKKLILAIYISREITESPHEST